jgi:N-glycosylase/DNA lyase
MKGLAELKRKYELKKDEINNRLKEFKQVLNESDERIFAELAFCICTPQSKATLAWNAITTLMKNNLLRNGDEEQIRESLKKIRFYEKKAGYIVEAREFFTKNEKLNIKEKIRSFDDAYKLRSWLVENVKGLGMKEASHFLRNVGFNDFAILDRHILKSLREYGVIKIVPKVLTKKLYLEIEEELKDFARKLGISPQELDLLLWSEKTGIIFK